MRTYHHWEQGGSLPSGSDFLHDPLLNKGTAFTEAERDKLGLRGLLPPRVLTQEQQLDRIYENYRRKGTDMDRYIFLMELHDRNERLFYRAILGKLEEMMPIIYTPVVGEACKKFTQIFRRTRGMYISKRDRGQIKEVLQNWPESDIRVIVVTDGERILGLGDLGAGGMGISIGKLTLYTACAGVHPAQCLPITVDVGTNNGDLLSDPLYIGLPEPRIRGEEYDAFIEEFVTAVYEVFPNVLLQFEDFGNQNAFRLLGKYRDQYCTFNDDIQGTAAVTLSGMLSAEKMGGLPLEEQRVVFLGAGEAAVGIADLLFTSMRKRGLGEAAARQRLWLVDSKGLVVKSRTDLREHKLPYAHAHDEVGSLDEVIDAVKPTALIGVSGQPQTFTEDIIGKMSKLNERPIIFALSNPTSKAECTAEQAYKHSKGRAIFASGSPFAPVEYDGRRYVPGQSNNAYIFPGMGLGIIACGAKRVTDSMFYAAAQCLANQSTEESLSQGCAFPPLSQIRVVSLNIACEVAEVAYEEGLAAVPRPCDLREHIKTLVFEPDYLSYV